MIDGYASDQGVAIAGHRAYFLKGIGVKLQMALVNYALNFLMDEDYVPLIVRPHCPHLTLSRTRR